MEVGRVLAYKLLVLTRRLPVHLVARVLNVSEDLVFSYLEREMSILDKEERVRREKMPEVREAVAQMRREMPEEDRRTFRKRYLISQIEKAREAYVENPSKENEESVRKLLREKQVLDGSVENISDEKIQRAREYPMRELVGHSRGNVKCPFHNDKTPSMDIRNNFYYCYGCGEHGDVIDFVMKTRGLSFKDAVNTLVC